MKNSHRKYSLRKSVLENFAQFTGKYLCHSLFLIKLQGFHFLTLWKWQKTISVYRNGSPLTLLKGRLQHRFFTVNLGKFLRTFFSRNTSGWLLLIYFLPQDSFKEIAFVAFYYQVSFFLFFCLRRIRLFFRKMHTFIFINLVYHDNNSHWVLKWNI